MKFFPALPFVLACCLTSPPLFAMQCDAPASICLEPAEGSFALIENGRPALILTDEGADPAVKRAAASFAGDLERVSGRRARQASDSRRAKGPAVVIGVAGESPLIDGLVEAGKLELAGLEGQWEAFEIEVVDDPWPNVPRALIIAGSDRRGAVYGAYDLSEQMGVSPWYWFADVPVERRANVYVAAGERTDKPGVRYRGFFINDEDPAFSSWAKKQFGGVNAGAYERVFELLLRLKGNYIWPAMWAPKSFHLDDPRNAALASEMGVVMGTSHHEPLTRAQAEWHRLDAPYAGGEWNYQTNAENLRAFWRGALERMVAGAGGKGHENLLTIGMRGDGDEPMSEGTAIELLERIVADQRALIEEITGRPASEFPQVWALYKEVQDYYDQGMTVPDDVTLLFADDNWGQIRRLPTKDLNREGGFGVYYHFDYVGAPRNYKWVNTNQIEKVWQQMNLAYERGVRNIWIVNVGDIKPMEYPLDFFMKMAWAPEEMTPEALAAFPYEWAARQFGEELAPEIGALVTGYSKLAARRKPELVNENAYSVGEAREDVLVRGEWSRIVGDWRDLVAQLEAVKPRVPEESRDAFFQLVEFPILAVSNLYEMYFATAWNRRLAASFDPRGNVFLTAAEKAFARDAELTRQYHSINGGKWDGMMSQVHMNYVIWNDPTEQTMPALIRTAGDVPEKMRNPEALFVDSDEKPEIVAIEASAFDRNVAASGLEWTPIPHLGQSKAALVALPQGRSATAPAAAPRVEYDVSLPDNQGVDVRLILAPTLDTIGKEGVRIGVSLDDGPVETLVMDLEPTAGGAETAAQRNWYEAVINNRVVLSAKFDAVRAGTHTVKVWRLDDNVVLEKIEVVPR
ncbi:MAG: hypothetical protein Kow00133_12660 [Amphiplicatus sp.]